MTDRAERLVNLTVALLEARRPLSFAELREAMGQWQQEDHAAARRMFERDKEELRRLGVPIETRDLLGRPGELGYVVDRAAYEQPDVEFTPEQVAALAVAVSVAGGSAERRAWARLAARAPDPDARIAAATPADVDVRVDLDPVLPLAQAIVEQRRVRFRYRTRAGEVGLRTVDPWAVSARGGAWYLVGRDASRRAPRAFHLARVEGAITTLDALQHPAPADLDVTEMVSGPADDVVTALVRDRRDGRVREVTAPRWRLVQTVLRELPNLVVEAPGELVAELDEALAAVAAAHA